MLCEFVALYIIEVYKNVLILVLMEDALRELYPRSDKKSLGVLILVLMEDALRALHHQR